MATIRKGGAAQWEARIRKRGYPTTCKTCDTKVEAGAWDKGIETTINQSHLSCHFPRVQASHPFCPGNLHATPPYQP